jgi:16S rRNA (cytidine1402-2'-O)-methyltransferase
MVFYESPYRLVKLLQELFLAFGADRKVCVTREISKVHEQRVRGTLADALVHFTEIEPRGEFVIVVAGKDEKENK